PGLSFPHRLADGSWSNSHKTQGDDNHGFYLGTGTSGNPIQAGLVANALAGPTPLQVNFADVSTGSPSEWQWNFGNGMTWNGQFPPTVTYTNYTSNPISYSVSLRVQDATGSFSQDNRVNYITVFPSATGNSTASFTFEQLNLGAPSLVSFTNISSGNLASFHWNFDDGSTSTAHSPMHVFNAPGFYDVVLRVTDTYGNEYLAEQTIYVYPSFSSAINVDFGVLGQAIAGDFTRFEDLCSGGPSFARKLWDFGDGILQEVIGIPIHLYYSPGTYQVRLEVRDYLDNLLGVQCKCITVIPDALNDLSTDMNQLIAPDLWWDDMFGRAVATDGEWAFIGAPYDDDKGSSSGSVYVYRLGIDSTWNFFQKIIASNGTANDYFGSSLACSGHRMIVGAPGNSNTSRGKAIFYAFNGQSWQMAQSIPSPSLQHYHFGWSVSMDGGVACISAPNNSKSMPGAAWIYRENNGSWSMEAKLFNAASKQADGFGFDVAIQGNHAVTAVLHPAGANQVWFWRYGAGTWQVISKRPVDKAYSVSIDCPYAVCGDTWSNRLIIYAYDGNQWMVDGFVYPADGAAGTDDFGSEVSI
ncbi:MAG: PKD domain-containing protein, partial [Bacteroidales bacterium]|nr:PKD domain-containing protein [Bacteroidales bacterium]